MGATGVGGSAAAFEADQGGGAAAPRLPAEFTRASLTGAGAVMYCGAAGVLLAGPAMLAVLVAGAVIYTGAAVWDGPARGEGAALECAACAVPACSKQPYLAGSK